MGRRPKLVSLSYLKQVQAELESEIEKFEYAESLVTGVNNKLKEMGFELKNTELVKVKEEVHGTGPIIT